MTVALSPLTTDVPVLILGGMANAVAATRSLGRAGVTVRVSGDRGCTAMFSRHCAEAIPVPKGADEGAFWESLLLGGDAARLDGHLLLPLSDEALEFVVPRRKQLSGRYRLEDFDVDLRAAMLDKRETLKIARAADVPAPNNWDVTAHGVSKAIAEEIVFPVMVKPIHSHKFSKVFGRKLFIIEDSLDDLREKVSLALDAGLEIMVVEMIPGPDDLLSSYYTYVTPEKRSLFHYTKRVIRRFPVNRGGACHHESVWLPETAAMGKKFFAAMPWQGMANIEFKRDTRDGKLKVIEVNSRFTAAHRLVLRAGMPIDLVIYRHLTGQDVPDIEQDDRVLRLLDPYRDFRAFLQLSRRGRLAFFDWLKSLFRKPWITPVFSLADPMPSFHDFGNFVVGKLRKLVG